MIQDVDESLRELVNREVVNGQNVEVSFESPTTDWASRRSGPALNLYLYDIREDIQKARAGWQEERNERGIVTGRSRPDKLFELSYLVTAWTQRPEDEHRLLSAMLACVLRHDILPEDVLQGAFAELPGLRITVGLPPPQDSSIADVWSALGGELKPSLDVVVTAPFPTEQVFHFGPPVLEDPRITIESEDQPPEGLAKRGRRAKAEPEIPEIAEEEKTGGKPGSGRLFKFRQQPRG